MPEQRFVNLDHLSSADLMDMHEYLRSWECRRCVGTGLTIALQDLGGFMAILVDDEPCSCCSGTGQHYQVSNQ